MVESNVGVDPPDGLWSTFSDEEWSVMADAVPEIGDYRAKALLCGQSPTAAIWATWATIGAALPSTPAENVRNFRRGGDGEEPLEFGYEHPFIPQKVSRLVSLFGKSPQPITSYLCVLGAPGQGKSEAVRWASPFLSAAEELITPCSGQAITTRLNSNSLKVYPKKTDKDGEKVVDDTSGGFGLELQAPNYVAFFDEAAEFDKLLNGSGANLPAAFNKAFFGEPHKLAQAAATADANRAVPGANQRINVGLVLCAQPGTLRGVVADGKGFRDRLWWCAMSGGETNDELPEAEVKRWFAGWRPPFTQPFTVGVDPGVRDYLDAAMLLVRMRGCDGDPKFERRYDRLRIIESKTDADWWLSDGGTHGVARVARLAASICLMAGRDTVAINDLRAAMIAAKYSATTLKRYETWLRVFSVNDDASQITSRELAKKVSEPQVLSAAFAINELRDKIADRILRKLAADKRSTVPRRDVCRSFGPSWGAKIAEHPGVTIPGVLDELIRIGRVVVEADKTLRTLTPQEEAQRFNAAQKVGA